MQRKFVAIWILATAITLTRAYEGYLFYLNFFNLTHLSIPNTLRDKFFQEIFISGEIDTTIIIRNLKSGTKETKKLFSTNQSFALEFYEELGGNNFSTYNASVIVSSLGGPISVQANKATRDSGDGYLALPLSDTSTEYFLASYSTTANLPSLFTISPITDGTCLDIVKISQNGTWSRINRLSFDANEVFYGSMEEDITGIRVSSSKPIAVFSGSICAKIPLGRESCDHIIEQMIPVKEWGTTHFATSFQGIPWSSGFIVRVISVKSQNVTIRETNHFLQPPGSPTDTSSTINVNAYNFTEYFVRGHQYGPTWAVIECPETCMIMQYGVGKDPKATDNLGYGSNQDPFMVTVPSIDHYPKNVHFSTSHLYKLLNNDGGFEMQEAINFITVVMRTDKVGQTSFDGGTMSGISGVSISLIHNLQSYTAMLFKIAHGFHSVTSSDPNNFFAVFVYGFGLQSQIGTGNPTGYGYLGGYKYGSGSNLIRTGPWFDPNSPLTNNLNVNSSNQNNSNSITVTMNDLPFQIGIWNMTFCTIYPLDNIIRKKCSEGYRDYFKEKRLSYIEKSIGNVCTNATVSLTLLPVQYSEYTCGNIYILIRVTGMKDSSLRTVVNCMDAINVIITPLSNWMEDGKYRIDKVIDPSDDKNIGDCAPVHFRSNEKFVMQARGWTCPESF